MDNRAKQLENMSQEELMALATLGYTNKLQIENKEMYHRYYHAKKSWVQQELNRVIDDNNLREQLVDFPLEKDDFATDLNKTEIAQLIAERTTPTQSEEVA